MCIRPLRLYDRHGCNPFELLAGRSPYQADFAIVEPLTRGSLSFSVRRLDTRRMGAENRHHLQGYVRELKSETSGCAPLFGECFINSALVGDTPPVSKHLQSIAPSNCSRKRIQKRYASLIALRVAKLDKVRCQGFCNEQR